MSDFQFQPWPGTIAITTLLEFCSWLLYYEKEHYYHPVCKYEKRRDSYFIAKHGV